MRRVMIGAQDLVARHAQMRRNDAADPHLLAQGVLHRLRKRSPRVRKRPQGACQNPLELQHGAFVKHDGIEIGWFELCVFEAPLDGFGRKAGIVLPTRKPLFLHGAHRQAVDHQRSGRVVIVGGDAKDLHVSTGSSVELAGVHGEWGSSQSVPGAATVSRATQTVARGRRTPP